MYTISIINTPNLEKIERYRKLLDENKNIFKDVNDYTITIKSLPIYDHVYNDVKYIIENISTPKSLNLVYYNHIKQSNQPIEYENNDNSLIKLLQLFNGVRTLQIQKLNRSGRFALLSKIKNSSNRYDKNDINIIESIKQFLSEANLDDLHFYIPFDQFEHFSDTIMNNENIRDVIINVKTSYSTQNLTKQVSIPKIREVHINSLNDQVTIDTIKRTFQLAPNFSVFGVTNETENQIITKPVLEEIMNYITSAAHVKDLYFTKCILDKDVEYICDKLINIDIHKFGLVGNYGYDSVSKIANVINKCKNLNEFTFAYCNGSDGFIDIIAALATNKTVENFSIIVNGVDTNSKEFTLLSRYVLKVLSENYTLRYIDIKVRKENTDTAINMNTGLLTLRNLMSKRLQLI